ncbi:hypothetical protein [Microbulbifer epialgicus]|uniref:Resolvase, N terminal domain n=1 Tax=Microbulbifer epialgicus TaxID=393907 RepID=A0ABV4NUD5_9GAMM
MTIVVAHPYIRYSSGIRARGDSVRRQIDKTREFAETHGLDFDDDLGLHYLGVSVFRGNNLESEQQRRFISLVKKRNS